MKEALDFVRMEYGIIEQTKPGFARVYLDAVKIPTDWLPVVRRKSLADKESWQLEINEHVVCLLDEHCNTGIIIGAIHDMTADVADDNEAIGKFRKKFSDGTIIEYDKNEGRYSQVVKESSFLQDGKFTIKVNDNSLKEALTLIIQAVQQIVVMYGNNPDYAKLSEALTKVNNIFK